MSNLIVGVRYTDGIQIAVAEKKKNSNGLLSMALL